MDSKWYIFENPEQLSDADLLAAYAKVSARRRAKAMAYRNVLDCKLSVIAELLLMRAAGIDECHYRFVGHGKPVLVGSEMPHFNLSHCTEAVACVVSSTPVGVDVEPYDSYDEEVAATVFNASEQARVMGSPRMFAELWTVKESYLKYTAEGLTDHLPQLLDNIGGAHFATYHSDRGYACTMCMGAPIDNLTPTFIGKTTLLHG